LNHLAALEPVPAVSMKRSCRECRGVARSRIASAIPASSSTVFAFGRQSDERRCYLRIGGDWIKQCIEKIRRFGP